MPDIVNCVTAACCRYGVEQFETADCISQIVILLIEDDYRRLRSFRRQSSRQTWLTAIARHYVTNYVCRQKIAMNLDELSADRFASNPSQESRMIWEEEHGKFRFAIGRLTSRERQLFDLLCLDDLTSAEIAAQMGIKLDSVYRKKHALIEKLRNIITLRATARSSHQ